MQAEHICATLTDVYIRLILQGNPLRKELSLTWPLTVYFPVLFCSYSSDVFLKEGHSVI